MKIDLITRTPTGAFKLIAVEEGPWEAGTEAEQLSRLQGRLNDYLNAVVGGHIASRYPESLGKPLQIQVDGYDLPDHLVSPFIDRFAKAAQTSSQVAEVIGPDRITTEIAFIYEGRRRAQEAGWIGRWRRLWRRLTME